MNLTSIGVPSAWWMESAVLLERAGFRGVWCWDHFISRGHRADPVLECWTTLAAAAAMTRTIRVGSFVTNVMNRHPAVLARMAATVQDQSGGRLELGIGIGGHPAEHAALGIAFPEAPERAEHLEEAVTVLRALWGGGPVSFEGRHYALRDAIVHPLASPAPRIVIGGETRAGARLAARIGDAWTTRADRFAADLPVFQDALEAAGRSPSDAATLVSLGPNAALPSGATVMEDLAAAWEQWHAAGADEIILAWVRPADVPRLLAAAERAGLTPAADDPPTTPAL